MKLIHPVLLICIFLMAACSAPNTQEDLFPQLASTQEIMATVTPITPTAVPATPTYELIVKNEDMLPRFDYDPALPFDIEVISEEERDGVIIQDVTYKAYNNDFARNTNGRINAYIVKPVEAGSYAGVLFLHQLEKEQNRKEFLDEAVLLARQGVVSVLPDGIIPWKVKFTGSWEKDQANIISQVIELRRALDFLLAQPGVDSKRIGCVGHDYGAMHASLLAAVDKRVKTYVLMTGDSTYSNWALRFNMMSQRPDDATTYRNRLAEVDSVNFIAHADPASLLFQFAETDRFISRTIAEQYFEAASEPKQILWYKSGHNLNEGARQDRIAWLTDELDLSPVP